MSLEFQSVFLVFLCPEGAYNVSVEKKGRDGFSRRELLLLPFSVRNSAEIYWVNFFFFFAYLHHHAIKTEILPNCSFSDTWKTVPHLLL
jgi:hypothetical protein